MKWRSSPDADCIWVPFDDDFVLYHRPSGKTHFLNSASRRLLADVLDQPKDLEAILEAFRTGLEIEDTAAYSSEMIGMLSRLEHLGLIERI